VQVQLSDLPDVPFEGTVDLVVVAEFLYYVPDLAGALEVLWSVCEPGAHVVVVHWAHHPHDAFRSGPAMHAQIRLDSMRRGATSLLTHVDQDFLLDVYETPR
jgi:SAM-dependent methyltransferase